MRDGGGFVDGTHLCIATNPPFGTKITIKDPHLLQRFDLAHSSMGLSPRAPDILFLEKNMRLLRPKQLLCPLQIGPSTILVWTLKEETSGQGTRA